VYELQPEPYVAFIRHFACSWFPGCYLEWKIDNELIQTIESQIGSESRPMEYSPEYVVSRRMTVTAFNNDVVAHSFFVIANGTLLLIPDNL
jgi:hypothetical protein